MGARVRVSVCLVTPQFILSHHATASAWHGFDYASICFFLGSSRIVLFYAFCLHGQNLFVVAIFYSPYSNLFLQMKDVHTSR
jgi:hypothetical protein